MMLVTVLIIMSCTAVLPSCLHCSHLHCRHVHCSHVPCAWSGICRALFMARLHLARTWALKTTCISSCYADANA
jgi:hypothetical protein